MPTQSNESNRPAPAAPQGASTTSGEPWRTLRGRWTLLVWAALVAGLLYLQWPMVKGMYYKVTDAEAPASAIAWRHTFGPALEEAARTGKPVLVDFTASWCPPCKVMAHDVWPDAEVADAVNSGYIPVLMDVDLPQNGHVAQRYGITTIPAILVLDADGNVLRQGAFMSRRAMLAFLAPGE